MTEIRSNSAGKYSASQGRVVIGSTFNKKKFDCGVETIRRHSHSGGMQVYRIINRNRERLSASYPKGEQKYGHCDCFTWWLLFVHQLWNPLVMFCLMSCRLSGGHATVVSNQITEPGLLGALFNKSTTSNNQISLYKAKSNISQNHYTLFLKATLL